MGIFRLAEEAATGAQGGRALISEVGNFLGRRISGGAAMLLTRRPTKVRVLVWFLLLMPLGLLSDTVPGRAQKAYEHALSLYHHGRLANSQQEAEWGYMEFRNWEPMWAARFKRLEAEVMLWRGLDSAALRTLAAFPADAEDVEGVVQVRALEANALAHRLQFTEADQRLAGAERICQSRDLPSCGEVLKARGSLYRAREVYVGALQETKRAYAFALAHRNLNLQTTSSLNIGLTFNSLYFFDEAQYWLRISFRDAVALGDEDLEQLASSGLGLAYFQFGDAEESRRLFQDAVQNAARLGNLGSQLRGVKNMGEMDAFAQRYSSAIDAYRLALKLARQIDQKQEIATALLDLADVLTETGKLDEAGKLLDEAAGLLKGQGNGQALALDLLQGDLAFARHEDAKAEEIYRRVQADPRDFTAIKSRAGGRLGETLARQGRTQDAETAYQAALAEFELARGQAKGVGSQLPLLTIGMPIYERYIRFLVGHGRFEDALAVANQSRARTLERRMDAAASKGMQAANKLDPRRIAEKAGVTLLFYWLADKESYLWVITAQKVTLVKLPPEAEIAGHVQNYRKALLERQDPLATGNADGRALYSELVAPAASQLRANAKVIVLDDASLSKLNFETLLAPGSALGQAGPSGYHYWIEDVTLRSAPSLTMLENTMQGKSAPDPVNVPRNPQGKLLLMGNADSASPDYPELPMAGMEMDLIKSHFASSNQTVMAHGLATPAAYLSSGPARYSYIHFVTHGVASSTDPLDSSIILSRAGGADSAFKLYARDILRLPIGARLVTISACYGSGSRAYSGEGLVGLSWAFLGAGAQNVIGALWEVSDESTPRLMDGLYGGIQRGQEPSVALRSAKLALLHSSGSFRAPFFWAPFQVYAVR
jgi:CHAT domain-containing protein